MDNFQGRFNDLGKWMGVGKEESTDVSYELVFRVYLKYDRPYPIPTAHLYSNYIESFRLFTDPLLPQTHTHVGTPLVPRFVK